MTEESISIPLILGDKISKIKIGKILDPIDYSNSSIISDDKEYRLEEKRIDKSTKKYIGKHFAEQTSKYVIMSYNDSTHKIEMLPVSEWFLFKKDMELKTINIDKYDEHKKSLSLMLNLLKHKGVGSTKKTRKTKTENAFDKNENVDKNDETFNDYEDKEESKSNVKKYDSHSSENDIDLKDCESDIVDQLKKKSDVDNAEQNSSEEDEEYNSSDSYNNNDEIENASSEINEDEFDDTHFLGEKRLREDNNLSFGKNKIILDQMNEELDKMLSRNKKMTYEKITKEMKRTFSPNDIELYLGDLLDKNTKMFDEKGVTFYFKKI